MSGQHHRVKLAQQLALTVSQKARESRSKQEHGMNLYVAECGTEYQILGQGLWDNQSALATWRNTAGKRIFSIRLSAVLPLCRDGIGMIKDVFETTKTLDLAVGRLELQRDRFDEWREIWRDDRGEADLKFEIFAKAHPLTARRVLRQLALMSQALFDAQALEDKFGIKPNQWPDKEAKDLGRFRLKDGDNLTLETQGVFLERCKYNMTFIKRCKFVLRKKDALWNSLIDLIKEYNENLATYGPKPDLERMLKGEFDIMRKMQLAQLRRLAEAATYEARHSEEKEATKRYHDLSLAAQFSAVVKFEREHSTFKFTMRDFRFDSSYALSSSRMSTMALLFDYPMRKEHRVVLIEWIEDVDRDQERDTRIKTLMLATPKPEQLLLPTCYGMVEDPVLRRFGLVLAPPAHIRSGLPPILPAGAISQKRMPVSLRELLDKRHPSCPNMLDLGIRFKLAKKLVDAVHAMHCVGWVHKNIRSNSILFFPAANTPSRGPAGPASGFPQPIGYTEPLFVGLANARQDDVVNDAGGYYEQEPDVFVDEHGQRLMRITKRPQNINLDYHQHPDKRWNPTIRYSRAHDIYSLGCVLLEIGLWKPLDQLVEIEDDDFERVKKGFQGLTMKLEGLAGSIYAGVVRRCLAISTGERTEAETRLLWKFCADIAATLDKCCA